MPLNRWIDPIARWLLELRTVSSSQWILRELGVITSGAALLLASGGSINDSLGSVLVSMVVTVGLLVQVLRPDNDAGVVVPLAVLLLCAGQADLGMLRAAGVGLCLLVAHMAFAVAATLPVHGGLSGSAWAMVGRGAALVLGGSVVAGAVVAAVAGVQLGPWMIVPGVLAVIGLLAIALPRGA